MKIQKNIAVFILIPALIFSNVVLVGCSASSPDTLSPYRITEPRMAPGFRPPADVVGPGGVNIRSLADARTDPSLGSFGGSTLRSNSDVNAPVRQALEDRIRGAGLTVGLLNSPSVGGEIKDWYVSVVNGFPVDRAEARATIVLDVFDADGQVRYRGTYKGTAIYQRPFMSQSRIEETLGQAMGEALDAALDDGRFLAAIETARTPLR
jgi:uncharacterized lipoprotein YajG